MQYLQCSIFYTTTVSYILTYKAIHKVKIKNLSLTLSPLGPVIPAAPLSPGIPCRPGGPWVPGEPAGPIAP